MNPIQHIDSQISSKTTIMWVFRALSIVPTLVFLAGLNGSLALAAVALVFLAPFTAVHWTMLAQIKKLKAQRALMFAGPMLPFPPNYPGQWAPPVQRPPYPPNNYPPGYGPNYRH